MALTRDEVLEVARGVAAEKDWSWCEPVDVKRRRKYVFFGPFRWHVWTGTRQAGCNIRLLIDDESGSILEAGFNPR